MVRIRRLVLARRRARCAMRAVCRPRHAGTLRERRDRHGGLQPAGDHHHRRRHHAAGRRHQGVRHHEQRHRVHQARCRAALYPVRRPRREPRELAPVHSAGGGDWALWVGRRGGGRGDRVLRLHRVRRRQHGGAGSQEPTTRHAHRHHRIPVDLHRALHLGVGYRHGVVPYRELNVPDPIAVAADHAGLGWMATLIKLGAIAGLSSVILVMLLGQSRVFWSMSRDGLLPPFVNKIHPRFQTPYITSIWTGVVVAFFAAILPIRDAASLVSIGTLLAFVIVSIGVLVLRVREPNLPRVFRTPAVWAVAPLGAFSAAYLMKSLPPVTWERLIIWFVIGMVLYFSYGVRNSKLAKT